MMVDKKTCGQCTNFEPILPGDPGEQLTELLGECLHIIPLCITRRQDVQELIRVHGSDSADDCSCFMWR